MGNTEDQTGDNDSEPNQVSHLGVQLLTTKVPKAIVPLTITTAGEAKPEQACGTGGSDEYWGASIPHSLLSELLK